MRLWQKDDEKEMNIKEYFCIGGHRFSMKEAKEFIGREHQKRPLCPHCWPNGLMRPKDSLACKAALQRG